MQRTQKASAKTQANGRPSSGTVSTTNHIPASTQKNAPTPHDSCHATVGLTEGSPPPSPASLPASSPPLPASSPRPPRRTPRPRTPIFRGCRGGLLGRVTKRRGGSRLVPLLRPQDGARVLQGALKDVLQVFERPLRGRPL